MSRQSQLRASHHRLLVLPAADSQSRGLVDPRTRLIFGSRENIAYGNGGDIEYHLTQDSTKYREMNRIGVGITIPECAADRRLEKAGQAELLHSCGGVLPACTIW